MNATTLDGSKFDERCKGYFRDLIETKWECEEHGAICVVTDDKQHFEVSERHIERWIEGMCKGTLDTGHPPEGMFEDIRNGAVWNRSTGEMSVEAVHSSPRRRSSSIASSNSASSRSLSFRSLASGASGPGYFTGLLLEKIGESILGYLDKYKYQRNVSSCLKEWAKRPTLGVKERKELLQMLAIAISLSRPSYSAGDNRLAFECGKRIQDFLESSNLSQTPEDSLLRIQAQTCLLPLLFTQVSNKAKDAVAGDLAWELSTELLRTPIGLLDSHVTECNPQVPVCDTAGTIIFIIGRELAYSPRTALRYPWLPLYLINIIQLTMRVRRLTQVELDIIWELVLNRQRVILKSNFEKDSRPWEIALFALCDNNHPSFRRIVLSPIGIPTLIQSLHALLSPHIPIDKISWENVASTSRVFAFLSEIAWTFEDDLLMRDAIDCLCTIFKRDVPQKWVVVHYWVIDTLYNIIARQKGFLDTLVISNLLSILDAAESAMSSVPPSQKRSSPIMESKLSLGYNQKARERICLLRNYLQAQGNQLPVLQPLNLGASFESSGNILNLVD